ncbi:hypothetical protein N5D52_13170 [Pseudomonas sp. GD03860]|uniref:hypothetical protein n=1 Tax=Pseudomonas TaxID=286 RepID=UPI0023639B77|nr:MULTISPECIES: hypothetical protein [Pseudomonas]MDD2056905.1 hypothetical protein [Pseudomonas putida]MDH0637895.1 hypothetical protein [Pseudomonas sp. GD03860]
MNKLVVTALIVATIALASPAIMAKGGNPHNNGNYDLKKIDTTPLLVWRNGKLVKNPAYAIERSNAQDQSRQASRASEEGMQDE